MINSSAIRPDSNCIISQISRGRLTHCIVTIPPTVDSMIICHNKLKHNQTKKDRLIAVFICPYTRWPRMPPATGNPKQHKHLFLFYFSSFKISKKTARPSVAEAMGGMPEAVALPWNQPLKYPSPFSWCLMDSASAETAEESAPRPSSPGWLRRAGRGALQFCLTP